MGAVLYVVAGEDFGERRFFSKVGVWKDGGKEDFLRAVCFGRPLGQTGRWR